MTFDVSLRANGCYTAQGPPSIIGPLRIRDLRGRPFLNPLYAFDGCFGTA
jgi:ABC-2 type transport system permease protein